MSIYHAALRWAQSGFRIFPLLPGTKRPAVGHWKEEATVDPAKIAAWWADNPNFNYGVACGRGLLVVDIDTGPDKNGYASLLDLDFDLPADTIHVRTPSGGEHVYLCAEDVANSVGDIAPGIDIRSEGGYVVGPGSVLSDAGKEGRWELLSFDLLAPAPSALVYAAGSAKVKTPANTAPVSVDDPKDVALAVHYLTTTAPIAVQGKGGDNTTYQVAAKLMDIGLSSEQTLLLMKALWNPKCAPPWADDELAVKVENAGRYKLNPTGTSGLVAAEATAQIDWGGSVPLTGEDLNWNDPTPEVDHELEWLLEMTKPQKYIPLTQLKPTQYLVAGFAARKEVTLLCGPSAASKSAAALTMAVCGANGADFLDMAVKHPFKTLVYNLEDSEETMRARAEAIAIQNGFDPANTQENVTLWAGEKGRLRLTQKMPGLRDPIINAALAEKLIAVAKKRGVDVIVFDPMVSLHQFDENDNGAMAELMDILNRIADEANVAVIVLVHTPKSIKTPGSLDMIRGASAIGAAARIAYTMVNMDESMAAAYPGMKESEWKRLVRLDEAKQNHRPRRVKPIWLRRESYLLPSGDPDEPFDVYALREVEVGTMRGDSKMAMADAVLDFMTDINSASQEIDDEMTRYVQDRVENLPAALTQAKAQIRGCFDKGEVEPRPGVKMTWARLSHGGKSQGRIEVIRSKGRVLVPSPFDLTAPAVSDPIWDD